MTPLLFFYYSLAFAAGCAVIGVVLGTFALALAWLLGGKR